MVSIGIITFIFKPDNGDGFYGGLLKVCISISIEVRSMNGQDTLFSTIYWVGSEYNFAVSKAKYDDKENWFHDSYGDKFTKFIAKEFIWKKGYLLEIIQVKKWKRVLEFLSFP